MASFLTYLFNTEKALEERIKTLLDQLPTSKDPETLRDEVKKLKAQLEELKERRKF
jgi:chromosome segregation ATPase